MLGKITKKYGEIIVSVAGGREGNKGEEPRVPKPATVRGTDSSSSVRRVGVIQIAYPQNDL